MIHPEIAQHIAAIQAACREFGVMRLEIFGSATTDAFDPKRSDVDFLVTYPESYNFGDFGARLFRFEERLTAILERRAHLVMTSVLAKRVFREEAARSRILIYDATSETRGVA